MVKVLNPFGAVSCHGKVGGMIYQSGRYGQVIKAHVPQRKRPSQKQIIQNYFFGVTADNWRLLTDEQRAVYNVRASGTHLTGFNLYMKENIQHSTFAYYGTGRYGTNTYY